MKEAGCAVVTYAAPARAKSRVSLGITPTIATTVARRVSVVLRSRYDIGIYPRLSSHISDISLIVGYDSKVTVRQDHGLIRQQQWTLGIP
jgi:hypothetical protein